MAIGSGMSAQVGWELETLPGELATVTAFAPFLSETLTHDIARVESDPVTADGRVARSDDWVPGERTVGGDLGFELYTRGLGKLLTLLFGSVTTTQVAVDRWAHTYTPGPLTGVTATVQVGKPDTSGIVHPFTYGGCKAASWELAIAAGQLATLGMTIAAQSEALDVPLAAPVYPVGIRPLAAHRAALTLDGAPLSGIRALRLAGDNGLDLDRRPVEASDTISEPLEDQRRTYTGTLDGEFRDAQLYQRFLDGAEATLTLTLSDGRTDTVEVAANVRLDGTTPHVPGRDPLNQPVPFACLAPSDDASALTVTVTNNSPTP